MTILYPFNSLQLMRLAGDSFHNEIAKLSKILGLFAVAHFNELFHNHIHFVCALQKISVLISYFEALGNYLRQDLLAPNKI